MTASVAELIVRIRDDASAKAQAVAASLDKIAKAEKAVGAQSAEMRKLATEAQRSADALKKMGDFRDVHKGLTAARTAFREAQKSVQDLGRKMAEADKPTRELTNSFKRAQNAVRAASTEFERQKTAVVGAKQALQGMGISIDRLASSETRFRASIDQTTAAIKRQSEAENHAAAASARAESRRTRRREALHGAVAGAGIYAGYKARHFLAESGRTYREFDKERRFGKAVMGLSDADQAPLVSQAIHMGATTKYNDIQVLEAQRELAARGVSKNTVMGMMPSAANLGMALDLKLPDAVKQMEGAIFGFKKNIETTADALAAARQTADLQVKAAKISGMTPEDITQAYKYGATPARLAGVSEQTLLAFAGISKKANMGGDESGVAFRSLMATAQSPTRGAKEALLANGLDFKNYQKNRDQLLLDPFVQNVAAQYGVKLNKKAQAGLGSIFTNKELISDPAKFTPAVLKLLGGALGGDDAKSKRSIAGMANRYRSASMDGIDTNAFIRDLMLKIPGNLQLANAIFGAKQGGRIASALGDPATFKKMIKDLTEGSDGYAANIAGERMAGFDGAVSRFEGAIKNLETAIGRSFDNDGKGGLLTGAVDTVGKLAQSFAELDSKTIAVGTAFGALAAGGGAIYGGVKLLSALSGGFGLQTSALALDGSAAALTRAAVALGGASVAGGAVPKVAPAALAAASWFARARALMFNPATIGIGAFLGANYLTMQGLEDGTIRGQPPSLLKTTPVPMGSYAGKDMTLGGFGGFRSPGRGGDAGGFRNLGPVGEKRMNQSLGDLPSAINASGFGASGSEAGSAFWTSFKAAIDGQLQGLAAKMTSTLSVNVSPTITPRIVGGGASQDLRGVHADTGIGGPR